MNNFHHLTQNQDILAKNTFTAKKENKRKKTIKQVETLKHIFKKRINFKNS